MLDLSTFREGDRVSVTYEATFRVVAEHVGNLYVESDAGGTYAAPLAALVAVEKVTPPKPAEPTGLGAVVEDAAGDQWVRAGFDHGGRLLDNWRLASGDGVGNWQPWSRIDAVRVLSEGVTP